MSEQEIRTTLKNLGTQVEGQVPPELYRVANLVSAQAPQKRRPVLRKVIEVAAACVLLGSIVGMAAYRNLHPAEEVQLNPDACGYRDAILDNLRLAAQTLPLPSAKISLTQERPEDSARQAAYYAESGEAGFRSSKAQGRLGFQIVGDEALLSTWSGESMKDPGYGFTSFRFTRGQLTESSQIPEILTQLGAAAASGQVRISSARTLVPKISKEEYYRSQALDRYSWNLKDVLRWYEADVVGVACEMKTVPSYQNGPLVDTEIPMLQLIPNRYVGFQGDQVVTYAPGEGMFGGGAETIWYTVPGLKPTDSSTGTPIPQSKRNPAERARLQDRFDKLKAEADSEEAKLAAMTLPKLEEVGEAAYTKAVQENAEQGAKVKDLHIQVARAYAEMVDPLTDAVRLEKEIERTRALYWNVNPPKLAALDEIERQFKAGTKSPQALLAEVEALLSQK